MGLLLFIIIFVIFFSGVFSGLEAALFAVQDNRVHVLLKNKVRGAKALSTIKQKIQRPIIAIVIGNNIANIVGSIVVGTIAASLFESAGIGIVSAILTLGIIIFGEIIPKTLGEHYNEPIALFAAPILLYVTKVLSPVIWSLERITMGLTKESISVSEEDVQVLSDMGHAEGTIEDDEREMIERVFTLNDLTAKDILTPRTVLSVIQKDENLSDLKEKIMEMEYSRIPVYGEDIDDIVGIVLRKDILENLISGNENGKISDIMRETIWVPETILLDSLLPLFQKERAHMAVVEDEFGGVVGVVTLEDVLEELVGEIVDETDIIEDTREEARKLAEEEE